jgi:hypothetical protein
MRHVAVDRPTGSLRHALTASPPRPAGSSVAPAARHGDGSGSTWS